MSSVSPDDKDLTKLLLKSCKKIGLDEELFAVLLASYNADRNSLKSQLEKLILFMMVKAAALAHEANNEYKDPIEYLIVLVNQGVWVHKLAKLRKLQNDPRISR